MGKTKQLLYDGPNGFNDWKLDSDGMPDDRWFMNPDVRFEAEYQEWYDGEGYVSFVNDEIDIAKPKYSDGEVVDALKYASNSIIIDASEVGKGVYDKLFSEKIMEYLNKSYEQKT